MRGIGLIRLRIGIIGELLWISIQNCVCVYILFTGFQDRGIMLRGDVFDV